MTAGELVMAECREHAVSNSSRWTASTAPSFSASVQARTKDIRKTDPDGLGRPVPDRSRKRILQQVTLAQALKHPNWSMGRKITIDSATLMNKGLEVIEARWLFGLRPSKIDVLIHPQSIIHSLVEFRDRSCLAQMSMPDMRGPIAYALSYPERLDRCISRARSCRDRHAHLRGADLERFPCLALPTTRFAQGGSMPAVLSAANEVAVNYFLDEKIRYTDVARVIRSVHGSHGPFSITTVEDALKADLWARKEAEKIISDFGLWIAD